MTFENLKFLEHVLEVEDPNGEIIPDVHELLDPQGQCYGLYLGNARMTSVQVVWEKGSRDLRDGEVIAWALSTLRYLKAAP